MNPDDQRPRRLYERCVDELATSLYRVAYRLTGHKQRAEDLVQETFLHAWRGIASLKDQSKARAWVFSILYRRNSADNRDERIVARPWRDFEEPATEPRATCELDDQDFVQAALDELDPKYKMPLLLVTMEGLSVDEAAEALGMPRGTVLTHLHRGREQLRRIMDKLQSPNQVATEPRDADHGAGRS